MKTHLLVAACTAALSFSFGAHAAEDTTMPMHPHPMEKGAEGTGKGMHEDMMKSEGKSAAKADGEKSADKAKPSHPKPRHNHMRDQKNM